nr:MAG TPA: hypothetical protein [Caudoviricetes sp.]
MEKAREGGSITPKAPYVNCRLLTSGEVLLTS